MRYYALAIEAKSGNFQVLSRFLEKLGIEALRVHALEDIWAMLDSGRKLSVAIIDVMGYGDVVRDTCRLLREKNVPMLIISPRDNSEYLREGYGCGAKGVFKKPVVMRELADCIRTLLPNEAQEQGA